MALPEVFWTSLFIFIVAGILIFFGLMVKKSLKGDCECGCAEMGTGMKKREPSAAAGSDAECECSDCSGCPNCSTMDNPYRKKF